MPSDDPEDTEDDLWADSADREITIRALAEHRAEDHLSPVEHDRRRDLARQARTRGELRALFADLPAPHPLIGEEPAPGGTWLARLARAGNGAGLIVSTGGIVVLLAVLAGWWVPALIFACLLAVATVFVTVGGR
jgi:hypothetical protein